MSKSSWPRFKRKIILIISVFTDSSNKMVTRIIFKSVNPPGLLKQDTVSLYELKSDELFEPSMHQLA